MTEHLKKTALSRLSVGFCTLKCIIGELLYRFASQSFNYLTISMQVVWPHLVLTKRIMKDFNVSKVFIIHLPLPLTHRFNGRAIESWRAIRFELIDNLISCRTTVTPPKMNKPTLFEAQVDVDRWLMSDSMLLTLQADLKTIEW